jgi:hypothetical protein
VFQHLDDPVPLSPSTREQRQSTLQRGRVLRRRRRAKMIALPLLAAAMAAAIVAALFSTPALWDDATVSPAGPVATPVATATAGPGRGTGTFSGSVPERNLTFTLPAGWGTDQGWVFKDGSDPLIGLAFFDVLNIYADGCLWKLVDPQPGPTVDDLVAAYATIPGFEGPARDVVTVDGFHGKQLEFTAPAYNEDKCVGGEFALIQEDNMPVPGDAPGLWAQTPNQENTVMILDVDGTRLVILAGHPPNISAQDRADIDAILSSIQIG